jgi:hypothetical protein
MKMFLLGMMVACTPSLIIVAWALRHEVLGDVEESNAYKPLIK